MTDAMKKAHRISLLSAFGILIAVAVLVIYYFLSVRPTLFDENAQKAIMQIANSPATTADQLRSLVLTGERALTQAFVSVDRAMLLLVALGGAASSILLRIAFLLKRSGDGA